MFKVSCKENCSHFLLFSGKLFIGFKLCFGFYFSIFCQSSQWFSYCYLTGSCRTVNEKILFFNKIYNSWRHNKSEPLQEPGLVGQFGPNPSSMIKLEVKHEITIRIIRELVIKEQFRYLTSPLPPPAALSTTEDTPSFIAVIRFRNNHQPRLNKINPMFNFPIDSI